MFWTIGALFAGLLLALSMPGPDWGWLAWIALIPLFWALHDKAPKQAFGIGWLAGAVYFGALLYWLFALWEWTSFAIIPGYILLVGYLALYWGAFAALYAFFSRRLSRWALVPAVAALWVGLEFARSLTRFGFPWGQAADALYEQLPFVQLAAITGVWGVSSLIIAVNFLLYLGIKTRSRRFALAALSLIVLAFIWGSSQLQHPLDDDSKLRITIIQPSIPQRIRSNPERLDDFLEIYRELLETTAQNEKHSELVILPESILPTYVLENPKMRGLFSRWAQTEKSALLLGSYTREEGKIYNSTVFISPEGEAAARYHKVQLVPFSTEYFPGLRLWKLVGISRWVPAGVLLGVLTPGEGFKPLQTALGTLATPICFESLFPQISRQFVSEGAQIIITITNDAWFKRTWALPQHFAKGVFRAVENGRFFVQAANTGVSGIIDPKGRIIKRSNMEERGIITGTVALLSDYTLYARLGDWWVYVSLAYLLGAFAFTLLRLRGGRSPSPVR